MGQLNERDSPTWSDGPGTWVLSGIESPVVRLKRSMLKLQLSSGFSPLLYTPNRTCHGSPGCTREVQFLKESVTHLNVTPMSETSLATRNCHVARLLNWRSGGSGLDESFTTAVTMVCHVVPLSASANRWGEAQLSETNPPIWSSGPGT